MTDEEKNNLRIENIKKNIDRLYNTASITQEATYTQDLIREAEKVSISDLCTLAGTLNVFGKCVLHYRLPIEMRINKELSEATAVPDEEREKFWEEYKVKLASLGKGPEEEYDKKILMACTLHVPLEKKVEPADAPENV